MGKKFLVLSVLLLSGCGSGLHLVYKNQNQTVISHKTGKECVRAYSSISGDVWTDYYPEPCDVYVRENLQLLYAPGEAK